jgi:hypothetical protein
MPTGSPNAGYRTFTTGEVLTAAQVQYNLQNQSIMYFASAAARDAALTAGIIQEGMCCYLADSNSVLVYDGSSWVSFSGDLTSLTAGSGITITSASGPIPTISIDTATTVSLTATQTLTNKTLTSPKETIEIVNAGSTGTINVDILTASVEYYTTDATANWTLNVRGNGSTSLDSLMSTGQQISVVYLNKNGATAYYPTSFTIDSVAVTPKWLGGSAPAAGNINSIDVYIYTIIKTGAATFTVLASQNKFA